MVYSKDTSKWKAYQFSDPFATSAFVVSNKITHVYCRPDCEAVPKTSLKLEVQFMTNAQASASGFAPCKSCDPDGTPAIDVLILMQCVQQINNQIGFVHPLLEEDEDINNTKIKKNILETKMSNKEHIMKVLDKNDFGGNTDQPRELVNSISLSKNDGDHYRLVDLACRHLAHAAAVNLYYPRKITEEEGGKKKRRRGGVLGFKELAAKLKLSAWHFHRVFKSVTGLTPKTYGDKCDTWLDKNIPASSVVSPVSSALISPMSESVAQFTPISNNTPITSHGSSANNFAAVPVNYTPDVPELNTHIPVNMPVQDNFDTFDFQIPLGPVQQQFQVPQSDFTFENRSYSMPSLEYPIEDSTSTISPATSLDFEDAPSLFSKDYKWEKDLVTNNGFGDVDNFFEDFTVDPIMTRDTFTDDFLTIV